MPRQARLDVPGVLQHVIARGIERGNIFREDMDRQRFVARFSALLVETGAECFAWALAPNHFHLLRTTQPPLSSFMRRLMTGHAVTFNCATGVRATSFRTVTSPSCVKKKTTFLIGREA